MRKCTKCEIDKELDRFYKKGRGHQSWCKDCANERAKKHYIDNKADKIEYAIKKKKERRIENKQYIVNYLSDHPCIDCAESDIVVLEFDHYKDKVDNIATLMHQVSLEVLEHEISKCVVRCANCHRRKTAKEQNNYRIVLQYTGR